jgi:hypothetical protein
MNVVPILPNCHLFCTWEGTATSTSTMATEKSSPITMAITASTCPTGHPPTVTATETIPAPTISPAVAANSIAERYKRLWNEDSLPVMPRWVVSWLLDCILLAGVAYFRKSDTRGQHVRVAHTVYALAIYFLHVAYLLSPLTATKFSALMMAGNVGVFTCSLAITEPAAIVKYQGILFVGIQQPDYLVETRQSRSLVCITADTTCAGCHNQRAVGYLSDKYRMNYARDLAFMVLSQHFPRLGRG